VIVLDINMPVMDGLTCLKKIMKVRPTPVVMVSSLTLLGAKASLDALALGAVDYIQKPDGEFSHSMGDLSDLMIEKIVVAANIKPSILSRSILHKQQSEHTIQQKNVKLKTKCLSQSEFDLIVIGVSTGGPNCLQTILPSLPANFPTPIILAQHMPGRITSVFSERLNTTCALTVIEVTKKQVVKQGCIYIAQGDGDIKITKSGSALHVMPVAIDKNYLWHPSVSKLVDSAMQCVKPKKLCCVQLTGMGNDGAQEMYEAHKSGATTIAESQETAVVYGMPAQLVKKGGATHVAPNHLIASFLL
jgi:two-component system chemotaxis response regulator CheB